MSFVKTKIEQAGRIEPDLKCDGRGLFTRMFSFDEMLGFEILHINLSHTIRAGTIRGLHYQVAPKQETKIVSCVKGRIYDVIVDLRPKSPSYLHWLGVYLNDETYTMMVIPPGCAHGFQALEDEVTVQYFVDEVYSQPHERGIRWDDPKLGIHWPLPMTVISDKDRNHPLLEVK